MFSGLLVSACGGDSGGSTGDGSTGTTTTATTTGTTGGSTSTGVTTGPTSSGESGQTDAGATSTGDTSTGAPETGSTGAPETGSTGSTGASDPGTGSTGESGSSSTGADLCAGFEPPGCMDKGCPEGQECKVLDDVCVSSACSCDPATGLIDCSPDCSGGSCVPDVPSECECTADSDCVKTSLGCCPCNSGGQEAPAHKDCVDQVMKCDIPPDEVSCPKVFLCTDAQPACVNGQCVLL